MELLTIDTIPNKKYKPLGLVRGSVVDTKHLGKDILASFKTIVGGEVNNYTKMLDEA